MGAAMGWTAQEVKAASMWEFFACWNGYVEANSPKDGNRLSESEKDDLFAWIDAPVDLPAGKPLPPMVWDGERLLSHTD